MKNFNTHLLLSLQRNSSPTIARTIIDLALKYQNRGVVGIDFSGDSTLGKNESILTELVRAIEEYHHHPGLKFFKVDFLKRK